MEIGDLPIKNLDKDGRHCNFTELRDVQFGANNKLNYFAINKILDLRWVAHGNKTEGWSLTKDGFIIRFDIRIATLRSCVWVGRFKLPEKDTELASAVVNKKSDLCTALKHMSCWDIQVVKIEPKLLQKHLVGY